MMKLDYSLQSPEERVELVEKILAETINPSPSYLEILSNYIVSCMEKQEKKEKKILTDNHLITINKREKSFEGLVSHFENGEDGIYSLIVDDKNALFQPKISITQEDLDDIPLLAQLRNTIEQWEAKLKKASGKEAFIIQQSLIEMHKMQYIIKVAYNPPIALNKTEHSALTPSLNEVFCGFNEKSLPVFKGVSLTSPFVCSFVLCNYSKLKQDGWGQFEKDLWYFMEDFDNLCTSTFANFPLYDRIIEYKIDGLQNIEIQTKIQEEFGIKYTETYISNLWRNKFPKMLASQAEEDFINWYYTMCERGTYKKCSRCHEIKLAHPKFFSRNISSKDGYYSVCKQCRRKKNK